MQTLVSSMILNFFPSPTSRNRELTSAILVHTHMLENQDSKATENIKGDIKSNKNHAETSVLEPEYLFQCRIHKRYSKIPSV